MKNRRTPGLIASVIIVLSLISCEPAKKENPELKPRTALEDPFSWDSSTAYFLLTDRFLKGESETEPFVEREAEAAYLRGFEGGNFSGITQKIREGYFDDLGIDVIWLSPVVEQIHGITDEGTGPTYGYHGYWAKDWTRFEPSFGTEDEFRTLVEEAHSRGIRILMDVVLNHTGPVTEADPAWPEEWVRTTPQCAYTNYENTTACTLVSNLPDILTESDESVEIPKVLVDKWESEGRLSEEVAELDAYFERTGNPRAPRFYIIKWLTDYIREFGVDGFRVDTVKHVNENAWSDLRKEADHAFAEWKQNHPENILDDSPFFMVGEVYGYNISHGREFPFGDKNVDYYDYGFDALINFEHKSKPDLAYEDYFDTYSQMLTGPLQGVTVMNYLSSHDDAYSFDRERKRSFESAITLLLSPGIAQIYYGEETGRLLLDSRANGDASLRTNMNWEELSASEDKQALLEHWEKLGRFRRKHPSIGAGTHKKLEDSPYIFSRVLERAEESDRVVVALDAPEGLKDLRVQGVFEDGARLRDAYSGQEAIVRQGEVTLDSPFSLVLLELIE